MLRRAQHTSDEALRSLDHIDQELVEGVEAGLPFPVLLGSVACDAGEAEGRVLRLLLAGVLEGTPYDAPRGQAKAPSAAPKPLITSMSKAPRAPSRRPIDQAEDEFEEVPTNLLTVEEPAPQSAMAAHARKVASENPRELASEQPRQLVSEQPRQLVSEQPRQLVSEQPRGVPSEKPRAGVAEKLVEVDALYERLATMNHYQLLGATPEADAATLRRCYSSLAKRFHPDVFFRQDIGEHRKKVDVLFAALTDAYNLLSSEESRREYDASIGIVCREAPKAPTPSAPSAPVDSALPKVSAASVPVPSVRAPAANATSLAPPSMPAMKVPVVQAPVAPVVSVSPARSIRPAAAQESLIRELRARGMAPAKPVATAAPAVYSSPPSPLAALAQELAQGQGIERWAAARLNEAIQQERAGHLTEAVALLHVVLTKLSDPRIRRERDRLNAQAQQASSGVYRSRALEAERANNHREAVEHWRKVLEGSPSDAEAALHVAKCFMELGDLKQAGHYARRASELAPDSVAAHRLLLKCFEKMGMESSASREREILEKLRRNG